jgi:uncharacterized membrane protein
MNSGALLAAPVAVQLHVYAALLALILGFVQLAGRKGSARHRLTGRVWVALMAAVALSSFVFVWGCGFDGLGPIHLLSAYTLYTLVGLVRAARRGDVRAHRVAALWLFLAALIGAGAFTLLPGRLMHDVAFGTAGVSYDCADQPLTGKADLP